MPKWPAANNVGRCRALHAIIALLKHTWSGDVWRGMLSLLWTAHTVPRYRAWHAIIALGEHTQSHYVGGWHVIIALREQTQSHYVGFGMPSSHLGSTHG